MRCLCSWGATKVVVAFELRTLEVVVVVPVDNSIPIDKEDEVDIDNGMAVEHEEDSFEVHLQEVVDSLLEASLDAKD
nr:hypothetical protein Iba_chr09cCG8970 [Ipomoea batatas]